jgi:hypothetical protein
MGSIAQVRLILHEITEAKQLPKPPKTHARARAHSRAGDARCKLTHTEAARVGSRRCGNTATLKKHSHHRHNRPNWEPSVWRRAFAKDWVGGTEDLMPLKLRRIRTLGERSLTLVMRVPLNRPTVLGFSECLPTLLSLVPRRGVDGVRLSTRAVSPVARFAWGRGACAVPRCVG